MAKSPSKNDITGDTIITKGTLSVQGRTNYDNIFKKNKCAGCADEHPHPSSNDYCYMWKEAPIKVPCSYFRELK